MLRGGREFEVRGRTGEKVKDALSTNVQERLSIVETVTHASAHISYGSPSVYNSAYWNSDLTTKGSSAAAVLDTVVGTFRYVAGCHDAVYLDMLGGILSAHVNDAQFLSEYDQTAKNGPLTHFGSLLDRDDNVAWNNWIPGDRGYITNPDPKTHDQGGFQGHNMVYVGGGKFSDAFGGTPESLDAAMLTVWRWGHPNSNLPSNARKTMLADTRRFPRMRCDQ